jgi:hypothetical protein
MVKEATGGVYFHVACAATGSSMTGDCFKGLGSVFAADT